VRIDSVNPQLVAGAKGEAEIASYVAIACGELDLTVQRLEPEPGRATIAARLPGSGRGRSLMLNAHFDTVGVEGMAEPFSAAVRDNKVFGRGACDMKGSLAAMLAAIATLRDAGLRPGGDVVLAAVADEEYGSLGTTNLLRHVRTDGAIVTEPTALDVCLAHKGYMWIEVETTGRAAHGSKFELGVDANMLMGRFLSRLDKLEQQLRARIPHPLVGPPSLHAALLQGGTGLSTYAAKCRLQIERRTVPGETEAQVMREIDAVLTEGARAGPWFVREPFEVRPAARVVQSVAKAACQVRGRTPEFIGDTPWMDSALLAGAGIETVIIGPAGAGAHAAEEWVDVDSCVQLAEILALAILDYCKC
jgi:acetylornithine deacetylase